MCYTNLAMPTKRVVWIDVTRWCRHYKGRAVCVVAVLGMLAMMWRLSRVWGEGGGGEGRAGGPRLGDFGRPRERLLALEVLGFTLILRGPRLGRF